MKRYAAKLLSEYQVLVEGVAGKRRICVETIVLIAAGSARGALVKAKARGARGNLRYQNDEGNPVRLEFVGVMELLELGIECASDEVWFEVKKRVANSERRKRLIPPESELTAIRNAGRRGKKKG